MSERSFLRDLDDSSSLTHPLLKYLQALKWTREELDLLSRFRFSNGEGISTEKEEGTSDSKLREWMDLLLYLDPDQTCLRDPPCSVKSAVFTDSLPRSSQPDSIHRCDKVHEDLTHRVPESKMDPSRSMEMNHNGIGDGRKKDFLQVLGDSSKSYDGWKEVFSEFSIMKEHRLVDLESRAKMMERIMARSQYKICRVCHNTDTFINASQASRRADEIVDARIYCGQCNARYRE